MTTDLVKSMMIKLIMNSNQSFRNWVFVWNNTNFEKRSENNTLSKSAKLCV